MASLEIQAMLRDMDTSMRRHRKLKNTNPQKYREKLQEENAKLWENYSLVFEMHFQGKLDATFFEMLKLKRKMELGELTEDQASRQIGQNLFDRYVGPVVNGTPAPEKPMSYTEFYDQYNKDA